MARTVPAQDLRGVVLQMYNILKLGGLLKIVLKKISELRHPDYNPRRISKRQKADLKRSLQEFGVVDPAIVNTSSGREGIIIGGNQRVTVAGEMGWDTFPCFLVDLPLERERELNIRLNKNTGDWDPELLLGEFSKEELLDWGFLEDELPEGFNAEGPVVGLTDDDDVPDSPVEPKTRPGDLYLLGEHRLLCGDATDASAMAALMGGDIADICVTDPPYNVDYEGKTKEALRIQNDKMGDSVFFEFLYDAFISVFSYIKAGGVFYVFHADSEGLNFRRAYKEAGFLLKQCCVWVKNSFVMGRQDYQWQHEPVLEGVKAPKTHDPILYGWKPGAAHEWFSDRRQTTVWEFDRPRRSLDHPTMKPVELIEYPIGCSSDTGAIVLDPFGGSGSTLIACHKLRRKARIMELDPKYCDVIVRRWEEFTGEEAILAGR